MSEDLKFTIRDATDMPLNRGSKSGTLQAFLKRIPEGKAAVLKYNSNSAIIQALWRAHKENRFTEYHTYKRRDELWVIREKVPEK